MKYLLTDMSADIKKRIADYLPAKDAIAMSQTCKEIYHDLGLCILIDEYSYHRHIKKKEHSFKPIDYHEGHRERIWFRFFPVLLSDMPIHTICFSCIARDQGWGNRKSKIYVRKDKNENNYQGDIVCDSGILEHFDTNVTLQFQPEPGKKYTLCYVIGGGGGHETYVKDPQVQTLYYHNDGVIDAANSLSKKDIVSIRDSNFGVRLLIGVVDRMIRDNNAILNGEKHKEQGALKSAEEDDTLASSLLSLGIDPHNNKDSLVPMRKFLEQWFLFKDPRNRRSRRKK